MTHAVASGRVRTVGSDREAQLLNVFFVLYKNSRIVEPNNRAHLKQCAHFHELLRSFLRDTSEISLKAVGGRYFANERYVRFDDGNRTAAAVVDEWQQLGIGGVRFSSEVTEEGIRQFFAYISSVQPGGADFELLQREVDRRIPGAIALLALPEEAEDDAENDEQIRKHLRLQARSTFFRAISVVEEMMSHAAVERELNIAKTRRVVHALIDHIGRDQDSLLELAAIKDFDDYTYAHSINVSVYSLTLGSRLGLDRPRLSQLGFAALFHDIGKVRLDRDLIQKPDSFDENDWIQMQMHPILGAKTILRNLKLDAHTARAARGALEHHINSDFTGYPLLRQLRPLNLFSRIITIADTFDALSSGRVYFKKAISIDQVIRKMRFQMGMKFDPFLLKLFNGVMGIYPPGTMVLLNTNEIAVVMAMNQEQVDRPYIQVIGNRSGLMPEPEWINLAEVDHAHRSISRMIDADRYGLKVRDFILSDGPSSI